MDKIIRTSSIVGSRRLSDRRPQREMRADVPREDVTDSSLPPVLGDSRQDKLGPVGSDVLDQSTVGVSENYAEQVFSADRESALRLSRENEELKARLTAMEEELRQACAELRRMQEAERTEGYQAGFEVGVAAAEEESEQRVAELHRLINTFEKACEVQIAGLESLAVDVGLTALCRVIEEKITARDFVVSAVRNVLAKVKDEAHVVIRVNPRQVEILQQEEADLAELLQHRSFKLVADTRVALGGCLVETDGGNWDGRLETQLQRLIDLAIDKDGPRSGA